MMDFIFLSLIGIVILGVLLIYKALRKCCKCICRKDYDPEIATPGRVPHYLPSGTATTRTAGTTNITPGRVPHYLPSGTATTRTAGTTNITPHRLPWDDFISSYLYDPEISTPGRVPHHVPCGTRALTRIGKTDISTPSPYPQKASTTTTVTSVCLCTSVIKGVVTYVVDGDGFRLFHSCPGESALDDTLNIRLAGIDAPEMGKNRTAGQPYSKESKAYLMKLIRGKTLFLEKLGVDQYKRILAMAYLPDPKNTNRIKLSAENNVNLEMVARGLACVYIGKDAVYGKYETDFLKAELEAKILKKGMWATDGDIVTPMEYKKQLRACQPQPIFVA